MNKPNLTLHAAYCNSLRDLIDRLKETEHDAARIERQCPALCGDTDVSSLHGSTPNVCATQAYLSLCQSIRALEEALHGLDLDAGRVNEVGDSLV